MENNFNIGNCYKNTPEVGRIVLGEGPPGADIMLIGQNPGAEEDKQGRPFVGRSGKYLNKVLAENNIKRETLFITSVVKYKTPGNRKPTKKEIEDCLPLLIEQIKSIKPKLIVLMGEAAWQTPRLEGVQYMETYHPAAAMRFPGIRAKFETDFQRLGRMIDSIENRS